MKQKPLLMLIDDDQHVLETFKLWLEDEGYQLQTATSKKEALEILKVHPIAVCLVDLKMKEENGLEISRKIKEIDSLLKIIIITGYPSYDTAVDAMKMGIFDYVSKSSENKDILKKIENAIEVRRSEIAAKEESPGDKHNIILVCHHMMIKEGFENFCHKYPDYRVTHTYHSVEFIKNSEFNIKASLVLICQTCNQHCVEHREELCPHIHRLFPHARLVMINCHLSDAEKKDLIRLGIKGFLLKNISKESMKKAFFSILRGQIWVSREVASSLLNELVEETAKSNYQTPQNPYNLSNREIEILEVIASGLSNFEISNKLFISEKTVKAHINHIFKKLGVKSRTQAVKKSVEEHII
jgi:DNA-binding NarL/FixJ family response regulator